MAPMPIGTNREGGAGGTNRPVEVEIPGGRGGGAVSGDKEIRLLTPPYEYGVLSFTTGQYTKHKRKDPEKHQTRRQCPPLARRHLSGAQHIVSLHEPCTQVPTRSRDRSAGLVDDTNMQMPAPKPEARDLRHQSGW